jgi:putative tricarboxylic transport membrane protein
MKRTMLGYVAALAIGILVPAVDIWSAPPKFPDKPVEFIVQGVAGGSSDIFVRQVVKMISQQKLVSVPIRIVNKQGGSGAVANNYLKSQEGNPYFVLQTGGNFVAAPLRDPNVAGYRDFTPISRLTIEMMSVIVRADSPYKTIKDLVDRAKKGKPGEITWGIAGMGAISHLPAVRLEEVTGTKFTFVSFDGTNESTAAVLGGHVQVGSIQPAIAKSLVDAGKLRMLAVTSEKRVSCVPDVPTFEEQGFDVVLYTHRGFVAAAKIPDDAKNSLSGLFEKLSQSGQWKDYVAREGTDPSYLPADQYKKWFAGETAKWENLLKKGGIIK